VRLTSGTKFSTSIQLTHIAWIMVTFIIVTGDMRCLKEDSPPRS